MINIQPIEARAVSDGALLDLHSVFHTIQGEGPFTGHRAVFVRLAGCNLQCPKCDTEYTEGRRMRTVDEVLDYVRRADPKTKLVVITGGEPFRQNLQPFVHELLERGYKVQIETNGVLPIQGYLSFAHSSTRDMGLVFQPGPRVFIVCSPKTNKVHENVSSLAIAYKYVVTGWDVDDDGFPTEVLGNHTNGPIARPPTSVPVYIQPADEGQPMLNRHNVMECTRLAMQHGHILQLQVHKLIEVQ